ncbi:MAG: EamA family transporter [Chloroflexi bacterium]|nr:EamA family transporter [Chloroflexota bacterium]
MENSILYLVTVLIWGSTWLAIRFQLGVVAPELSIAYRFLLASLLLFVFSAVRRLPLRFDLRAHGAMALQGLFLFSLNYLLVYLATGYVTSGLVAVIFSSIIIFNILFGALFLKNPIRPAVVVGGVIGIAGLGFIYWPELVDFDLGSGEALGLMMATLSAASASLGNILSARNQRNGLPIVQTNAWGMIYGGGLMLVIALLRGAELTLDPTPGYIGSLLYLSLFGSVVAFGTYLTLLGRMGADRAAYITVLFPVIALLLSIVYEGLTLNVIQWAGVGLVPVGNYIALAKRKAGV